MAQAILRLPDVEGYRHDIRQAMLAASGASEIQFWFADEAVMLKCLEILGRSRPSIQSRMSLQRLANLFAESEAWPDIAAEVVSHLNTRLRALSATDSYEAPLLTRFRQSRADADLMLRQSLSTTIHGEPVYLLTVTEPNDRWTQMLAAAPLHYDSQWTRQYQSLCAHGYEPYPTPDVEHLREIMSGRPTEEALRSVHCKWNANRSAALRRKHKAIRSAIAIAAEQFRALTSASTPTTNARNLSPTQRKERLKMLEANLLAALGEDRDVIHASMQQIADAVGAPRSTVERILKSSPNRAIQSLRELRTQGQAKASPGFEADIEPVEPSEDRHEDD